MSGPVVPKICFICRNNAPGQPARMIEFRTEGTKEDGSPKHVMYEPNSNVKHVHYPRPEGQQQQQQQTQQQQATLPIDRIQETPRAAPDAPREKVTTPPPPIPKTYENNPDGSPKSITMACDICKQKGAEGQMIWGNAVGFDTTTQKYVWMFFDHDVANPAEHRIIHVHREKPKIQEAPKAPEAEIKQDKSGVGPAEWLTYLKEANAAKIADTEARAKAQAAIKEHGDKMLKATQALLANQEMYMKAIIRMINRQIIQLTNVVAAAFVTEHPDLVDVFVKHIQELNEKDRDLRTLAFAEDPVIFDALTNYDKIVAATPTTADKLIKESKGIDFTKLGKVEVVDKSPPEQVLHYEPTPGLCSNCGTQVPDINDHTCMPMAPPPVEDFKPTKEELAAITEAEDETPDIGDDRVFRI